MIIYALLAVLSMVSPMIGDNPVNREIDKSYICKTMYEHNLILKVIL